MPQYENQGWRSPPGSAVLDGMAKSAKSIYPRQNSPYEVIRFASREEGYHLLIVFRSPLDPKRTLEAYIDQVRQTLENKGFGNFVDGIGGIGARPVPTSDFDKPMQDGLWSCRHYFLAAGPRGYTLGFGTNRREEMFGLFDLMANSFAMR